MFLLGKGLCILGQIGIDCCENIWFFLLEKLALGCTLAVLWEACWGSLQSRVWEGRGQDKEEKRAEGCGINIGYF